MRNWRRCFVNAKQHHVHASSIWYIYAGGNAENLTVRESNWFHMTTAGISPGPGQPRFPHSLSRELVQLSSGGYVCSLWINLEFQRQFEIRCPSPFTDCIPRREYNSQKRIPRIQARQRKHCKNYKAIKYKKMCHYNLLWTFLKAWICCHKNNKIILASVNKLL